jgi:type IV secretion system protein VirD4
MSARVGYNTVDSVTRNRPRFWGAWQWRKQSVAAHPHSRAQLLPQEIFRMRHHQELIFRSGLVPVLADKIVYDQDPTFVPRVLSPPAVPEIEVAVPMDDGGMADPRLLEVGSTTR